MVVVDTIYFLNIILKRRTDIVGLS